MTGPASGEPLVEFLADMRRLRAECSWKREQTHRSLARYLLEETHETLEAIDSGDLDHLCEELGDLLLQVYFHAVIAEESGAFTIDDVARGIIEKMRRRNPHVFAPEDGALAVGGDAAAVNDAWLEIKAREKPRDSVTDGCPTRCPRCSTPTRSSTACAARVARWRPAEELRPIWASGSWPWSPRRRSPASIPSRRCATRSAAASDRRRAVARAVPGSTADRV